MKILWRKIKEYNYKISSDGQIKHLHSQRILKPYPRKGYLSCTLSKNGIKKSYSIHRLVAKKYIINDDPTNKTLVNHKDGNKKNNKVENLEWVTAQKNVEHAINNNLIKRNKKAVHQCDLSGNIINTFESIKEAEQQTGISSKHIPSVCRGKKQTCGGYKWVYVNPEPKQEKEGKLLSFNNNYLITKDGRIYSKFLDNYMKPKKDIDGYHIVSICKNGNKKDYYVHRLVALTFITNPKPDEYNFVNHIDKNKSNNNVTNLEWCNAQLNMQHHVKSTTNLYTVKVAQLTINNKLLKTYPSVKNAWMETKVDKSSIVRVCKGKQKSAGNYIWKYVA